jgi:ketopantoate reductase
MRALVVGAGAVGQVYARHLQLGGADVTFFVREKYRATLERGLDMYPLNGRRPTEPVRFDAFSVVSRPDEVAARTFDQVYLTVSSPALAGPWLRELIAATGDATIVALQPGNDERAVLLAAGVPADRLVSGMITLISYAAPLPGETRFPKPGMAYWFPPMAPAPHSGPRERTAAVVRALRAGKLPSKVHRDVPGAVAFPSAILMPYLVALETAGWSFQALGRGPAIDLGARGAREALAVTAATTGRRRPLGARVLSRPSMLRFALWFAARLFPLPLEIYLREHFTKVHAQTIEFIANYIAKGKPAGVGVAALEQLLAGVEPAQPLAAARQPERPVA